jgi:hypothetical protein
VGKRENKKNTKRKNGKTKKIKSKNGKRGKGKKGKKKGGGGGGKQTSSMDAISSALRIPSLLMSKVSNISPISGSKDGLFSVPLDTKDECGAVANGR